MSIPVSEINQRRVLREIWLNPGRSRVELAAATELNKSSITKISQDLLKKGMIRTGTEGSAGPMGGRKPVGLEINPNYGVFAGIETTESTLKISVLDFSGNEIFFHEEDRITDISIISETVNFASALISRELGRLKILNAGIGIPGMVDTTTGTILRSAPLKVYSPWSDMDDFKNIPFPISLENDANCCCWGELAGNRGVEHGNFIYVLGEKRMSPVSESRLEPGIGMGLALEGRVYRGKNYGAGEFRSIFKNGQSGPQLSLTPNEINMFFSNFGIRKKSMSELGKNIALLANVLNIDKVIMGGIFQSVEDELLAIMEDEIIKNRSYPVNREKVVIQSRFGKKAVSMGAACMVMEEFFSLSELFNSEIL